MASGDGGGSGTVRGFDAVTVALGVAAVAIAVPGWMDVLEPGRDPMAWLDVGIRSLKTLFMSDIYYEDQYSHWTFQLSRALGTMFAACAAGRVIWMGARTAWLKGEIALRRGHDVVLGDGPAAQAFAAFGPSRALTVLRPGVQLAAAGKVRTVPFAGSSSQMLRAVGAPRARLILIDQDDELVDETAAAEAQRAVAGRRRNRPVIARPTEDPWLLERESRVEATGGRINFSYSSGVARSVMLAHPPYLLARQMGAPAQHIVLIGFGSVGQALAREFLTTSVSCSPARMMITAIDPQMPRLRQRFLARHPHLPHLVDLEFLEGDLLGERYEDDASRRTATERLRKRLQDVEACAIYVAIDGDALGFASVVRDIFMEDIYEEQELLRAPIFVCQAQGANALPVRHGAGLLGGRTSSKQERQETEKLAVAENRLAERRIVVFGSWRDALEGVGLLARNVDAHAMRLHEAYRKRYGGPAWADLADDLRVSNRRAVAHVRAKADAAGFDLNSWLAQPQNGRRADDLPAAAASLLRDDPELIARLGELEHRRWLLDRALNGWRPGEARDNIRRIHPDMRPYEELGDAAREKDAMVVRVTRAMLEAAAKEPVGTR